MKVIKMFSKIIFGKIAVALLLCGVIFMSGGCAAPRITLQLDKPPTFNVVGISTIAVEPFEYQFGANVPNTHLGAALDAASRAASTAVTNEVLGMIGAQAVPLQADESVYQGAAQHATAVAISNIQAMNDFSLVNRDQADAILVGTITKVEATDSKMRLPGTQRDIFSRNVSVEFNYSLLRQDGSVIGGPIPRRASRSSSASSPEDLQRFTELIIESLNHTLSFLYRDFTPHTVTEQRRLAKDKSIKTEMRHALDLVSSGNHREALTAYLAIYEQHKSVAAAINASVFYELFGELQAAIDLMQQVVNESEDPQAQATLARLNQILEDQARLASDYGIGGNEVSVDFVDVSDTSDVYELSDVAAVSATPQTQDESWFLSAEEIAAQHIEQYVEPTVEELQEQIEQLQLAQAEITRQADELQVQIDQLQQKKFELELQAQQQERLQIVTQQRFGPQIDLLTRQRAACVGEHCAVILYHLGTLYYTAAMQMGGQDFSMAKQMFQQFLTESPNSYFAPQAEQILVRIEGMEN